MDPHVNLKRKAMLLLLGVAFLGALIAICLHSFETEPHFVNQIIPLLSALTTFILLRILENLMLQSNAQLGIILCDIDHFKRINDTYGHRVGDQVLQTFAHRFQSILLPKHTLVRWGGEEFLIIVPGEHEGEVMQQAERLRQSLADQDIAEVGQVTASFGVAYVYPEDTVEVLFEQADRALYQAKNQGRNQVVLTVRNFSTLVKHL